MHDAYAVRYHCIVPFISQMPCSNTTRDPILACPIDIYTTTAGSELHIEHVPVTQSLNQGLQDDNTRWRNSISPTQQGTHFQPTCEHRRRVW